MVWDVIIHKRKNRKVAVAFRNRLKRKGRQVGPIVRQGNMYYFKVVRK
jgi:hypothetical protein